MSKQTQKEAVYSAVMNVLAENNITVSEGDNISSMMTRELRLQVNQILVEGFSAGNIALDKSFNASELRAYVSGLQSNWLRKDTRLNGGVSYAAKNPGSRKGSSDPQLKALRALLSTLTDPSEIAEVQGHIDNRTAEISQTNKMNTTIDYSVLPPELAAKFIAS